MKFGSLQRKEQKTFKVRGFKSGTVMFPLDSDIPDNALTESENMWSESGVLCTRAGLCADSHNIIKSESPSIRDTFSYKVTDSTVCINGEQKKVAVEEYCLEDSIYYCNIFNLIIISFTSCFKQYLGLFINTSYSLVISLFKKRGELVFKSIAIQ